MLLIYGNESTWETLYERIDEVMGRHRELSAELTASGEFVDSQGLTTRDARTVRVRGDVTDVTDGPFVEAKEVLAGYYLVDCADAERAADIAARLPEAAYDLVEVRRVMHPDEFGA
ncbi:YciI family protein [Haloactinopolyspora alba]|nr:YciI family protein [Haloactinopolyspora alba]